MLGITTLPQRRYVERRDAEGCYSECRYARCCCAKCRSTFFQAGAQFYKTFLSIIYEFLL
jgi:hypothetical protein